MMRRGRGDIDGEEKVFVSGESGDISRLVSSAGGRTMTFVGCYWGLWKTSSKLFFCSFVLLLLRAMFIPTCLFSSPSWNLEFSKSWAIFGLFSCHKTIDIKSNSKNKPSIVKNHLLNSSNPYRTNPSNASIQAISVS
jgi:hypothetical protein